MSHQGALRVAGEGGTTSSPRSTPLGLGFVAGQGGAGITLTTVSLAHPARSPRPNSRNPRRVAADFTSSPPIPPPTAASTGSHSHIAIAPLAIPWPQVTAISAPLCRRLHYRVNQRRRAGASGDADGPTGLPASVANLVRLLDPRSSAPASDVDGPRNAHDNTSQLRSDGVGKYPEIIMRQFGKSAI